MFLPENMQTIVHLSRFTATPTLAPMSMSPFNTYSNNVVIVMQEPIYIKANIYAMNMWLSHLSEILR